MKQKIRLTEGDLHRIIRKCINEERSIEAEMIANAIEGGEYDELLDALDFYGIDQYFYVDNPDAEKLIDQAIKYRRLCLDKEYHFKHGKQPDTYDDDKVRYETYFPKDGNRNVNDKDTWRDWSAYDKDMELKYLRDKWPNFAKVTKDGKYLRAKGWRDALEKDIYGTDQADKRPLHRKGSLNRAMD